MKQAICTISTQSHLFKSQALLKSVAKYSQVDLFCLVTDSERQLENYPFQTNVLTDLQSEQAQKIKGKYIGNHLRWALKPIYLKYLLEQGYEEVIYVDNDIFFYDSPDFLFEKLKTASFLLTPHFYKADPLKDQNWLEANYRVGLYNAGFIGANKNAISILDWWAECCLYNVKKAFWRGLFDDQKYLDLVPILFNDVAIIQHRGCNFAGWNSETSELKRSEDKQLMIENDKLIFIHFAALSMLEFSKEEHLANQEYVNYLKALKKFNPKFENRESKREKRNVKAYFYYLRWNVARAFEKKNLVSKNEGSH